MSTPWRYDFFLEITKLGVHAFTIAKTSRSSNLTNLTIWQRNKQRCQFQLPLFLYNHAINTVWIKYLKAAKRKQDIAATGITERAFFLVPFSTLFSRIHAKNLEAKTKHLKILLLWTKIISTIFMSGIVSCRALKLLIAFYSMHCTVMGQNHYFEKFSYIYLFFCNVCFF